MDPDVEAALTLVAQARQKRDEAEAANTEALAEFRAALRAAKDAGATNTQISDHAALSRQRVNLATR